MAVALCQANRNWVQQPVAAIRAAGGMPLKAGSGTWPPLPSGCVCEREELVTHASGAGKPAPRIKANLKCRLPDRRATFSLSGIYDRL